MAEMKEKENMSISNGLDRALRVIYLMARASDDRNRSFGISEIARDLGMSKAVVHRIVTTLTARDFLSVNPETRRYSLGPGAIIVGLSALSCSEPHVVARRKMERLMKETGETSTFSMSQNDHRVYVDQVLSQQEIRMSVQLGAVFPLHAGSSSKAILAGMSDQDVDAYLTTHDLGRFTSATITDTESLKRNVQTIREKGFSTSSGERQGDAGSVASPIFDARGSVVGCISVCGPAQRFGPEQFEMYGRKVAQAAAQTSRELGYRGSWYSQEAGSEDPEMVGG